MSSGQALADAIEHRRELVNAAVAEQLPLGEPDHLYRATRHLFDAGGKRLRPAVTLLVAESLADVPASTAAYRSVSADRSAVVDGSPSEATSSEASGSREETIDMLSAAVSIETIQSFTLIHDDIMDDDDLRRGVPAVHREYDLETAILAGDTLYAKAFEFMLETEAPADRLVDALSVLAETCTAICEGQSLDIDFEDCPEVSLAAYLGMIEQKTAVLYAAAASIPAILLGAETETVDALRRYGLEVGQAFQVRDDLLDLTTPSEQLGKRRGSDLFAGKRTVVTLHAREQGVDVDELLSDDPETITDSEIDAAVEVLREAGSIEYARGLSRDLVERGKDRLEALPAGTPRDRLGGIADYLVERGY